MICSVRQKFVDFTLSQDIYSTNKNDDWIRTAENDKSRTNLLYFKTPSLLSSLTSAPPPPPFPHNKLLASKEKEDFGLGWTCAQ